jgi:4a-hydroxytetrahydrobiopterin dehydratase
LKSTSTQKKSNRTARNALLNILMFPGLGSLLAGRRVAGIGQIALVSAGSVLLFVWLYKILSQYYDLMFSDVKPEPVGWIGITGGILFVISWLWASVTSLSLFREAASQESQSLRKFGSPKIKLNEEQIIGALPSLPDWKRNGDVIARTFQFKDFPAAIKFTDAVALLAEEEWHHPDIDIRWNKVTLALTTHDAGGLTEKDFALAKKFDALSLR